MAEKITVGINGFGRIGRRLFRLLYGHPKVAVVAINDIATAKTLSHLLKYDSIHGILGQRVSAVENAITVGNENYRFTSTKKIEKIDWGKLDVVVECSGKYKTRGELAHHVRNGAKRVILSVPPAKDDIKTIVLGVNDHTLSTGDTIVSNASCTTNNAAPMLKTLAGLCGIKEAYITTVHSYTTDQSLHDQPHPDLRRARAAGQSIVPTTTGAAKALTKIFPHLANNIGGCGIRVPVANGSLTDVTVHAEKDTTIAAVNGAFRSAAATTLKNILEYTDEPLVSVDIVGNPHSCIFDAGMTSVIGKMVKIIGWYDNETGYASRLVDLVLKMHAK